jgi:arylsulfatase A-like enzyme
VAAGCASGIPVSRELTAELAGAEVCGRERCVTGDQARALHGADVVAPGEILSLPLDTTSTIYLRLPEASRLGFEFRLARAALSIVVGVPGPRQTVLFHTDAASDAWRRAEVATRVPAGTIARLSFGAESPATGPSGFVLVRNPTLQGRAAPPPERVPAAPGRLPNIVLYVIDTLRADHLGCYGYPRDTSPRLDAFAAGAIRFTHAVAQASWTRPATASILTGLLPLHHRAIEPEDGIDPQVPTLAELLHAAGYATAAFVVNPVVAPAFGFGRGFDRFRSYPDVASWPTLFLPADRVVGRVAAWLRHAPRPFFAYVHVADPHEPYVPPLRHRRRLSRRVGSFTPDALIASQHQCPSCLHDQRWHRPVSLDPAAVAVLESLYDGEIAFTDEAFGRLIESLHDQHRLEDTLVVVTADHGEEFLDHRGLTHGQTLYREVLHVPLLVRLPGGRGGGRTDARPAEQVDIAPTILDAAGVPAAARFDGESLLGPAPSAEREILSHLRLEGHELFSVTDEHWAFIRQGDGRIEIYDVQADPREQHDLGGIDVVLAGYAELRLAAPPDHARSRLVVGGRALDRLRALGYVN